MEKSGSVLVAAALGLEYGFTDIDGKQPRPITVEESYIGYSPAHKEKRMASEITGKISYANGRVAQNVDVRVFDKDAPGKGDDDLTITPGLLGQPGRIHRPL